MAELIWNEEEIQRIDSLKELGLQKLTLDINRRIEPKFAKENDTKSRGLDIQVKKDNKTIDTTGVVLKMYAMPIKEQEVYEIESNIVDASRGKYEIIYPTIILQAGTTLAEIVLTKDEQVISSKKFKIEVESRLLTDDAVKGHDAYPLFEQLLEAAKTIEGVDIAAEEERQENEIIRQTQEQQRQESMTDIENRFNLLETSKQQDAEVINARTSTVKGKTFNSLNDRLEETEKEIDKPLYSTPVETYDSIISLPDNTTNGQVSMSVKGETLTNYYNHDNLRFSSDDVLSEKLETGFRLVKDDTKRMAYNTITNVKAGIYTLKCNITKNTTTKMNAIEVQYKNGEYSHINFAAGFEGKLDRIVTFTDDVNQVLFYIQQHDLDGTVLEMQDILLIEGDWLGIKVHYFTGTKSTISAMRFTSENEDKTEKSQAYVVAKDKDNKIVNLMSHEGVHDEIDLDKRELIKRIGVDEEGLTYQLAEPEHIPIEVEGELQGYENGTIYFTPYIKDEFIVDYTKLIKLQYPIKAIDKLLKLDTANAKWIEVEGVLSEDGQTITVTEEGTYKVYGEIQEGYSTEGLKRIATNINLNAQINSNTTAIEKINNKIYTDADLFTAMLLQQEVRITALEQGGVI